MRNYQICLTSYLIIQKSDFLHEPDFRCIFYANSKCLAYEKPVVCVLVLFPTALGRKPEEIITSDLIAGDFPADVWVGGINLAFPQVAATEYIHLGRLVHQNATHLSLNHVINHLNEHAGM